MIQQSLFQLRPRDPDICRRKHGGADTSVLAHARVQKERDREFIFSSIQVARHGFTLDEMADAMGVDANRISGRFTELRKAGRIYDTGERRKTRTGSLARVYKEAER